MMPPIAIIGAVIIMLKIIDQHLLHLRGVVGRAGDQRGGAEGVELVQREVLDVREDLRAHDPAEADRRFSRRRSCRPRRSAVPAMAIEQHDPPMPQDVAGVALTMPVSTMSAISVGRYRLASDCRKASTSTRVNIGR